jgi:KDO2-lipid IV(A) lauroyltransferase
MSRILYYLVLLPISYLPFFILYRISDFFYVLMYYIIGYRKKVVRANLHSVFTEKSEREIIMIEKKFYRHFCDLVVETVKNFSISKEEALKRMHHQGTEIFAPYAERHQPVIIAGGHQGNWELWGITAGIVIPHKVLGIYKRLRDPYLNEKMKANRGRWGTCLVPTVEVGQYFKDHPEELNATVFAVDQSPANPQKSYWTTFLGRETACYYGVEKMSKDYNRPVIFGHIQKIRRGHYTTSYELITAHPQEEEYGQIIEKINRLLERDIYSQPETWLWSHKRWKHKRPSH